MEKLLNLLNQMMFQGSLLGTIPKPIKNSMIFATVTVGIVLIWKNVSDPTLRLFLIISLVAIALICAVYYGWKALKEKRQNENIREEISQHSSATPRSLSDPGQRARLEDLRKKFNSGVQAYKSRGKDLYKLPWYVIVGEPGSGKTEAIRHSNVGFPPGMQDEFQGVGGTINMNWWFTNHAVLLDTAGRLMFEDVKPGETSEWKEFLTLLKKNRPNCPVNGLFLVIPSDSLIKDSADSIQKKAGKIAQQLDVIQRVLDVRFPVFVVVTKCDKIIGFREFFDNVTDPQLQHQMMGWSNPAPLDEPFRPELVDKHLEQVANRLRRRRLGLVRDPIPENPEARRTDEVDTLYAFPHSMELLASRLRRYLETIFIAGEWSAKPLFLRGIYFSSSMREGSALDQELATQLGVPVDELPEGKVWERERAYFLRDLFLDKVFKERGLVTRATNTRRMLRTQQVALFAFGLFGLVAFCTLAWFAREHLKSSIKDQGDYWNVVSTSGWNQPYWGGSIVSMNGDGTLALSLSTNGVKVENKKVSLGEFHAKLRDIVKQPLKKNMFFPGLATKYNNDSHRAQRIVFEAGIIRPLIEATRQKMYLGNSGTPQYGQPDALAGLIKLESDILALSHPPLSPDAAKSFLETYESYIAGQDVVPDTNLVSVMSWTYSDNKTGTGKWVPATFSGRNRDTNVNSLASNPAIAAGLQAFVRNATTEVKNSKTEWSQIDELRQAVKEYSKAEEALFKATQDGDDSTFASAQSAMESENAKLSAAMKKAAAQSTFSGGVSLVKAGQFFRDNVVKSAGAKLERVRNINTEALAAHPNTPLFSDVKGYLDNVDKAVKTEIEGLLKQGNADEFQDLDDKYLANDGFIARAKFYSRGAAALNEKPFGSDTLLGDEGKKLEELRKEKLDPMKADGEAYAGKFKTNIKAVIDRDLALARKAYARAYFSSYVDQVQRRLSNFALFPLVKNTSTVATPEILTQAGNYFGSVSRDLQSAVFSQNDPSTYVTNWKDLTSKIDAQRALAFALTSSGQVGACKIALEGYSNANGEEDWRRDGIWRGVKLSNSDNVVTTQRQTDEPLGPVSVSDSIGVVLIKSLSESGGTNTISTGRWGPLSSILKNGKRDADGKTWHVALQDKSLGPNGALRLKLTFENSIPEVDKWPSM